MLIVVVLFERKVRVCRRVGSLASPGLWSDSLWPLPLQCRVMDQHKLSRDQWEDRIQVWHAEHRGMLK